MEIRNSLIIFVTNIFSSLLNSFVFFLAVRKYSPSDFGYLSLSVSLFAFFLFFSDLNFSGTHIKKIPDRKYSEDECFNIINEVTDPISLKDNEIGLMTLDEFLIFRNPENKSHPSDAYDSSLEDMNRDHSISHIGEAGGSQFNIYKICHFNL